MPETDKQLTKHVLKTLHSQHKVKQQANISSTKSPSNWFRKKIEKSHFSIDKFAET